MPLGLLSQVKEPVGALDHDVARVRVAVARVVEVAWDRFVAVGRVVPVALGRVDRFTFSWWVVHYGVK